MKSSSPDAEALAPASPLAGTEAAKMAAYAQVESSAATVTSASALRTTKPGRLRVLHVVSSLGLGGTECGVLKLIRGLDGELFEQRICAVRAFDPDFASSQQMLDRLFVAGLPGPGLQFPLFRLVRIMRLYKPHIVHSRNWGAIEAIPAARLAAVPVAIHSEHGYELEILAGLPYRRRLLRRAFYAMADAVFAVTEDLRSYHARQAWVSPQKIGVIYNGVDTQGFSPQPNGCAGVRKSLGIAPESFVVGTVGRLVPIKDHGTLLKAAEIVRRQGWDLHVLLIGSGPELAKLRAYAAASIELAGRVSFYGESKNVSALLNAMDVFALPSICEGMSNTVLEAMASGLPVVATRAGGNPELVEEGRTGWLFSPGDFAGLAQHLQRLASDAELRRRSGAAARRRIVERFGLQQMLQQYRTLYLGLATRCRVLEQT